MTKSITTNSDVVILGAGNVATSLAMALCNKNYNILQVFSRTMESAKLLSDRVEATPITGPSEIVDTADFYIYCLKDDVLKTIGNWHLPFDKGTHLHTSGTCPITVFEKAGCKSYGVLYPLMTFTKDKIVDFANIPLFVEANNPNIEHLARQLSEKVYPLDSNRRGKLHLAGVLSNNFVNALLAMSEKVLQDVDLDIDVLMPLVNETVRKAANGNVFANQTGPAVRGDEGTINQHRRILESHPEALQVYDALTEYIIKYTLNNPR